MSNSLGGDGFLSLTDPYRKTINPASSATAAGNNGLYLLVRVAPGTKQFSLPFPRATSWDRLITSLFQIYDSNNSPNPKCTLSQAYTSIKVSCDESGARILADFWAELLRPTMPILVEFTYPFNPPPWECHNIDIANIKREDDAEDVEMASCGMEAQDVLLDQDMIIDVDKDVDVNSSSLRKLNTSSDQTALASAIMTPLTSFDESVTPTGTRWPATTPNNFKSAIDIQPRNSPTTSFSLLSSSIPAPIGKKQNVKSVYQSKAPNTRLASVVGSTLSQSGLSASHDMQETTQNLSKSNTLIPSVSKVNVESAGIASPQTLPTLPFVTSASSLQQNYLARSTRDASAPPMKRKRKAGTMSSGGNNETRPSELLRAISQEPSTRLMSHRRDSFRRSTGSHANTASPQPPPTLKQHEKCTVLVQNALLLDAISAGEHIKIVKTAEGEIVAMRQEEDIEMLKRRNSVVEADNAIPDNSQTSTSTSRKRGHDDDMDALIRIWSGGGVPPSKKTKHVYVYDKLTPEDKIKLQKLVRDHHIIRIDHFTATFIEAWKADILPNADEKQCNEYIAEIASTVYNTECKRQDAYRLFLQANEYSPKMA